MAEYTEYRKIEVGGYFDEYAVFGFGHKMGDLFTLFIGTHEECYRWISENELDYLLEEPDEDE